MCGSSAPIKSGTFPNTAKNGEFDICFFGVIVHDLYSYGCPSVYFLSDRERNAVRAVATKDRRDAYASGDQE